MITLRPRTVSPYKKIRRRTTDNLRGRDYDSIELRVMELHPKNLGAGRLPRSNGRYFCSSHRYEARRPRIFLAGGLLAGFSPKQTAELKSKYREPPMKLSETRTIVFKLAIAVALCLAGFTKADQTNSAANGTVKKTATKLVEPA